MSRKTIIWGGLAAIVAAAGTGYYVVWNQIADNIKTQIAAIVDDNNKNDSILNLSYASLETRGFPFAFNTTLIKPVITLALAPAPYEPYEPEEGEEEAEAPAEIDTVKLSWDESLHISAPVVGKQVNIQSNGTIRATGFRGEDELPVTQLRLASGSGCQISTHTLYAFNQDQSLFVMDEEGETKLSKDVSGTSCDLNKLAITNEAGNTILAQADRLFISYLNRSQDESVTDGTFELRAHNMMVPQESVTALDDLYAAYGYESADSYGALYAQSGAINADMLMSIKGKDNDIHVQVTEMRYSDNVFALNATADINNSLPDKHVIKAEITSEFKPNYDKLMNDALSLSVFDMMQDPMLAMIMPGIASYVENIPEDERNQFMQDIMPSYERLGKLVIAVDAVLPKSQASDETATAEATADAPTSAIEVKRFEISSDLGGFLLSGSSGKLDQISIPSEVNGTLTCLKCTTMLDELYAYQNDLAPHLQAAAPETASEIPLADSKLVQAVKSFLQSAAKDPKATDLSYELALNDQATTINGKPAEELMMAFFTDVAPLLPQPQAAQDDEETEEDSTDESEDTESAE